MTNSNWYPLKLTTHARDYTFGERLIVDRLGKRGLPAEGRIAETWEISDYGETSGIVRNGPFAGRRLHDLVGKYPDDLVGQGWRGETFPLLAKFLDASHFLPIHLHADDETAAQKYGQPNGKAEAWHILDCADDATVLVGIKPGLDQDAIRAALFEQRWDDVLIRHPIRPGETVYVPGGVLHTFGPETVIFEIQQTSDLAQTAMPADNYGQPFSPEQRATNIEELLDELRVEPLPRPVHGLTRYEGPVRIVVGCAGPHFALERWNLAVPFRVPARLDRCLTLTNLGEPVAISWDGGIETLERAESCIVPAALPGFTLVPDGKAVVLACFVPDFPRDIVAPLRDAGYDDAEIATLGEVPLTAG
jgi:mannose-6-phosphate isomerase